jgi:hypothetical protein
MRAFWRAIVRTVFWSYKRGSWPYDLMVTAILLFVLATPRHWFHDKVVATANSAQTGHPASESQLPYGHTYRISAAFLSASAHFVSYTPEMEKQTHDYLSRSIPELQDRTFQVESIHPVPDSYGAPQFYDVTVRTVNIP